MSLEVFLAALRILVYVAASLWFVRQGRWWAWATLMALVVLTVSYTYLGSDLLTQELLRTGFGVLLLITLVGRK